MLESNVYSVEAVVELILRTFSKKSDSESLSLAIPGGRSPGNVLTALAKSLSDEQKERLSLLWVDERIVPAEHDDRNDKTTLKAWEKGGSYPKSVLSMPVEGEDLEKMSSLYEKKLLKACPDGIIDVCLLGIGEDGHFASLFPNHPLLDETENVFIITDSPKMPPVRMSLSLGQIASSRLNIVLCFGEAKGKVFKKAQTGKNKNIPISLLDSKNTIWFLDTAAQTALK